MSVAAEDKRMTLIVVYLTFGSVEGTDNLNMVQYHCAFQQVSKCELTELPMRRQVLGVTEELQYNYLRTCKCTGKQQWCLRL